MFRNNPLVLSNNFVRNIASEYKPQEILDFELKDLLKGVRAKERTLFQEQYKRLDKFIYDMERTPRPHNFIAILFALEGEFWKNPLITGHNFRFTDICNILPMASLAVFLCVTEDWFKQYIIDEDDEGWHYHFPPTTRVWIKDYSSDPRGKYLQLTFNTGDKIFFQNGLEMRSVVSYCLDSDVSSVSSEPDPLVDISTT
jgi:hypothetical protein